MPDDKSPAKPQSGDSEVFDVDRIRQLIELMKQHDLSEVDLRHATKRIRMRRGAESTIVNMPAMPQMMSPVQAAVPAMPAAQAAMPAANAAPAVDETATFIQSPMVGTYYAKPKPDLPPFVKVGDHVDADTVVCTIEAMKMFNEIPAGMSGTITQIMVKNEEPVEVNQPLFKIDPA